MPIAPLFTLTLAHINDTHSHFEPSPLALNIGDAGSRVYATSGGFARISTAAESFRQQAQIAGNGFLFLHAGDCFQGTLYYSLFKGEANADLLNRLNLDAMTIGNHELDLGNAPISEFLDEINFPLLAGNWNVSQEDEGKARRIKGKAMLYPYLPEQQRAKVLVKTFEQTKVAVFGVALDKMADISNPDPDTPFVKAKAVVENTISYLHSRGIKHIVLLSHLGYDKDLKLAEEVDGISVIAGGHSHVLQGDFSNIGLGNDEPYGRQVNSTVVVQAGCHAMFIGKLDVTLNGEGQVVDYTGNNYVLPGRGLALDASWGKKLQPAAYREAKSYLSKQDNILHVKGDPAIKACIAEKYKPAVEQLKRDIVTHVGKPLRHVRLPDSQGGSEISPLVTQGLLYSANIRGFGADFSIHNAGGVRVSIDSGPLTAADIAGRLLPFAIELMAYELTGQQVHDTLEGAIDNAINNGIEGTGDGSFPYTAKLRYKYECDRPIGSRITLLEHQKDDGSWVPIDPERQYTSVSTAYTAGGKEGYHALKYLVRPAAGIGVTLSESFIEYARSMQQLLPPSELLTEYVPCRTCARPEEI